MHPVKSTVYKGSWEISATNYIPDDNPDFWLETLPSYPPVPFIAC